MQNKAKNNIVYRKLEKKDYPAVMEFVGVMNGSDWECKNKNTRNRLKKIYFYRYLKKCTFAMVALSRNEVVGVVMAEDKGVKKIKPITSLKEKFIWCITMFTKEGKRNVENYKIRERMKSNLVNECNMKCGKEILLLYVKNNFKKVLVEDELLDCVTQSDKTNGLFTFMTQRHYNSVFEAYGFEKVAEKIEMMEVNRQRYREKMVLLQYAGKS